MEFQRIHENIIDDDTADSMDLDEDIGIKTHRSKKSKPEFQYSGCDSAGKRLYRLAAVCLGLLCVLLLTVIIVLRVKYTAERKQLQTSNTNLTKEKYETQKMLSVCERSCPEGWWRLNASCYYYFLSTEKKTWNESRQDCREREADLVIINSREEQVLVSELTDQLDCWIGLTDSGTENTWKWVDGTPLTTAYWASGQPNNYGNQDCGAIIEETRYFDQQGRYMEEKTNHLKNWNDYVCSSKRNWICEK